MSEMNEVKRGREGKRDREREKEREKDELTMLFQCHIFKSSWMTQKCIRNVVPDCSCKYSY